MSTLLAVDLLAPLCWQQGDESPVSEAAALRALATAALLGERVSAISEEAVGLELEVLRLHQKTQLLVELLALALARDAHRPQALAVQLSSAGCCWCDAHAPAVGAEGVVALWLHPSAPEPLRWPARIAAVQGEGASQQVQAEWLPLGEASHAALERQVFLLHRRSVAEARLQRTEPLRCVHGSARGQGTDGQEQCNAGGAG